MPGPYVVTLYGLGEDMFAAVASKDAASGIAAHAGVGERRVVEHTVLPGWLQGDVNGDGSIDDLDVDALTGLLGSQVDARHPGDIDGDASVTQADVTLLRQLIENTGGEPPVGPFKRYFAEGATGDFFDTRLALLNVSPVSPAQTFVTFQKGDGTNLTHTLTIAPLTRATVNVKDVPGMARAEFSTIVESDQELVADRTMYWNSSGYGSHAETSLAAASSTWYLAEGATHSGFDLFYLVQNPNPTAVAVRVTYLLPAPLAPVVKAYDVAAHSRFNIWVNAEGAPLASTDVSAKIEASLPIIVERAMYLGQAGKPFSAGHESAAVASPSTEWFLAEGATGDFFDLFVLIANPGDTD